MSQAAVTNNKLRTLSGEVEFDPVQAEKIQLAAAHRLAVMHDNATVNGITTSGFGGLPLIRSISKLNTV